LERPKYQFKPIESSINTGDAELYEIDMDRSASFMLNSDIEYMEQSGYNPYDFGVDIYVKGVTRSTYTSSNGFYTVISSSVDINTLKNSDNLVFILIQGATGSLDISGSAN
jgi:hypothetical protein